MYFVKWFDKMKGLGYYLPMDTNRLLELNQLARVEGARYPRRRPLYNNVVGSIGKHFAGIVGPRGSGKTVLLKQIAAEEKDFFYLSVDTLEGEDIFEIAKSLADRYKIKCLMLDEIHFRKNFEGELKKIFDFLNVQVVFTSSVALAMIESAHDLSRRVHLVTLYPFSFREYLLFKKGIELPPLSFPDIIEKKWSPEHLGHSYLFEDYLKGGIYPFALEEADPLPLFKNIVQKVIHKDIPLIAKLHTDEIGMIEKTLEFIGKSTSEGINYTSISQNIGITKYKAEQYIALLKKSFIINPIFPFGTNVTREPKVLMYLPYRLLYKPYNESLGSLREDFFAEAMQMSDVEFSYLKSKRGSKTPDFLIKGKDGKLVAEVGGKGKGIEQFKGIDAMDKIRFVHSDETEGNKRPLFMLGYLG